MVETHLETVGTEPELSHSAQRKQRTTRLLYDVDDAVISEFFAHNTSRSQALRDLIYLFAIEHGNDADVSQLLRSHLVSLAGLGPSGGATTSKTQAVQAPPAAPKARKKPAPVVAHDEEVSDDADAHTDVIAEEPAPQNKQEPAAKDSDAPVKKVDAKDDTADNSEADTEPGEGQQQMTTDFQSLFSSTRERRDQQ